VQGGILGTPKSTAVESGIPPLRREQALAGQVRTVRSLDLRGLYGAHVTFPPYPKLEIPPHFCDVPLQLFDLVGVVSSAPPAGDHH
jgi:hypothetical protein